MMGEKQENEHRAASTAKRPSPTSVKELLDIVHLQQSGRATRKIAVKHQDADGLSSRGAFNPLPAIGKSSGGSPPVSVISLPPKNNRPGRDEYRSRANSDGSQYKAALRSGPLSDVNSGAGTMPSLQSPRESSGSNHAVSGRQHQGRRDGTLPPLSELIVERPQSRPKQLDAAKTPLRRTASGGSQLGPSPANTHSVQRNDERNKLVRPKSSHGRRRTLPSDITEIHDSVPPAPYEDYVFNNTSPRDGDINVRSTPGSTTTTNKRDSSSTSNQRPKSSKGRARPSVSSTRSLSQDDEWSSEDDARPRAPSPPSPGLDSDLDSDNDRYDDGSNGRIVRPR